MMLRMIASVFLFTAGRMRGEWKGSPELFIIFVNIPSSLRLAKNFSTASFLPEMVTFSGELLQTGHTCSGHL